MPPAEHSRSVGAGANPDANNITLSTGQLFGNMPICSEPPHGVIVDHDKKKVYIFSPAVKDGESFSEIYCWDVESMTWDHLTVRSLTVHFTLNHARLNLVPCQNSDMLYHLPFPGDPFFGGVPSRRFPFRFGPATALFTHNDRRFLLIFGGVCEKEGPACSDLLALDLKLHSWFTVEVAGGPVAARMHPCAVVVNQRLYIFGGRRLEQGSYIPLESFSVAEYDADSHQWKWVVCDKPYPADVPTLGYACVATPVYGGEKVMLTLGCTDHDHNGDWEPVR
jgi:hypothetical protein